MLARVIECTLSKRDPMSGSPLQYCCISANCEAVQHFKASAFRHRCSDYWSKNGFRLVFTGWEYPSLTPTINSVGKSYFLTRIAEQTAQSCEQDGSFNDLTEKEVKAGFRFGWKMWAITCTLKCRQETSEIQPRWSRENDFSSFLAILTGKGVDFRSFDDNSVLNWLQEESNALYPNGIRWAVLPEHGVAENLWRNGKTSPLPLVTVKVVVTVNGLCILSRLGYCCSAVNAALR